MTNVLATVREPEALHALHLAGLRIKHRLDGGYGRFQQRYREDPARFARDCILWREDEGLTDYQAEILTQLLRGGRVAVRGPRGLGKTTITALAVLWFALTRDGGDGTDWKVITTASAWQQLILYTWPEIHKWARRLRWDVIGRPPFKLGVELLGLSLKLSTGAASSVASEVPDRMEGAHADDVFYVFDEAKLIPAAVFDSAEGTFAGAGPDTGKRALALAVSIPGEPNGRFYDIHRRAPGLESWWVRHVTKTEAIAGGRMTSGWPQSQRALWGEKSALYQNHVEGEFAASDSDGVIPLSWVESANQRWLEKMASIEATDDAPLVELSRPPLPPFTCVGVDVSDSGSDMTVMAMRYGPIITELRRTSHEDTMATSGRIKGILDAHGGYAVIDGIGIGAGVVARLNEQRCEVTSFIASAGSDYIDRSGELGMANSRSEAWWAMRELLDPANGEDIALPPDDLLTGDLTAPHWRVVSGGRIQIESKDDIRKRIGRSTDDGDAVVMSYIQTHSWAWA